jgi:hypothetical protein
MAMSFGTSLALVPDVTPIGNKKPGGQIRGFSREETMSVQKKSLINSQAAAKKAILAGSVKPGSVTPGRVKPGAVKPGALKPGALKPGALKPGAIKPAAMY